MSKLCYVSWHLFHCIQLQTNQRLLGMFTPTAVKQPLHNVPYSYIKCTLSCAHSIKHTHRGTEGTLTWHHAAHDKQGEGCLRAPRLVPLFLGCHLSLPQSILFRKALLNDVLKSDGDGQFPANMQHLQTYDESLNQSIDEVITRMRFSKDCGTPQQLCVMPMLMLHVMLMLDITVHVMLMLLVMLDVMLHVMLMLLPVIPAGIFGC